MHLSAEPPDADPQVREALAGGGTDVLAAHPDAMLSLADRLGLERVAADAEQRLQRPLEQR